MSYFAYVENGVVTQVIIAEQDVIDTGMLGSGWILSSHDGTTPVRKNIAGIGHVYNNGADAFIPQSPFNSWVLDANYQWQPPVPYPVDEKRYNWNEDLTTWEEVNVS